MIDLERFSRTITVVMPIINGHGIYKGRKVFANGKRPHSIPRTTDSSSGAGNGERNSTGESLPSGWYEVRLGLATEIVRRASPLETRTALMGVASNRIFNVILLGAEGIALNADIFYKRGLTESVTVNFASEPLFTIAKVAQWEDGRFYFFETILPRNRETIRGVRDRFEQERDLLGLRGVTPELRYYYLLANLQRQSYRAAEEIERLTISRAEKDKRIREFQSTFAGRLQASVERAGANLIKFSKYGKGWLVEWELDGQRIKSIIHDDLRLISAGFCLSGDDRRHTLNSIVNLARLFKRESFLNITRE